MLHTLNKAWTTILMRQAKNNPNKIYLFVATEADEINMAFEVEDEYKCAANCFIVTDSTIRYLMVNRKDDKANFPMFDDILISHSLYYQNNTNDFLNRHCKRRCC